MGAARLPPGIDARELAAAPISAGPGTDLVLMLARNDVFPFVDAEVERACALVTRGRRGPARARHRVTAARRGPASGMIVRVPGHGD